MRIHIPFIIICLLVGQTLLAQTAVSFKVAMEREIWHNNIDKQQKKVNQLNNQGKIATDTTVGLQIMDALTRGVDELQMQIEMDSTLKSMEKIKYLRSVDLLLQGYITYLNRRDFSASAAPALIKAFAQCIELDKYQKSFAPVIESNEYGIAKVLVDCLKEYMYTNAGMATSRTILMRKYITLHPEQIMAELAKNPGAYNNADSLIKVALSYDIRKVYDYAQAKNALSERIRNHPDSAVQLVARIAASRSGQLYFPFLDNLMRGKITLGAIDSVKDNELSYFRLMVKTRIEYVQRSLPPYNDTANQMQTLTEMMRRKAREYFIREINALHTVNNLAIRFRPLAGLSAQE